MKEKSQMEILYEKYLEDDNKVLNIGDHCFYKIISKDRLSFNGGTVMLVIAREFFQGGKICPVIDENSRVFELGGAAMHRFSCPPPRWYLETVSVPVKGIHEIDEIGDYLALAE